MRHVTILGAGLVGTLLAIYLARRGYEVEIFELRSDIRLNKVDTHRSINLALSCRGITGLAGVDIIPLATKFMVPMRARAIHEECGEIIYQAFGRYHDEYINAIERHRLNELLLNHAETFQSIHLNFSMKLLDLNLYNKSLHFQCADGSKITKIYQRLIGADGVNSYVRDVLIKENLIEFTRSFLAHGYKELSIIDESVQQLAREHLHIWPRESFLLLGNPNLDQSFTGSLFLAYEGKHSFAELNNDLEVHHFFKQAFPDAYPLMPNLIEEFQHHPTGHMSTIMCSPWYYEDHCLLIGDAAHGIIPFFGQGMNSGFEDCRILNELLEQHDDDWVKVVPKFYQLRKPNTDAVAQMSMENYREIQSDIRDTKFNFKKQLELALMHHYPERYLSRHVSVMFTNKPYADILTNACIQEQLLNDILREANTLLDINWKHVDSLMVEYDKKLAESSAQKISH